MNLNHRPGPRAPRAADPRRRPNVLVAANVAAAAGSLWLAAPPALASPSVETGCPAAWSLRTVESLATTGNAPIPGMVDASGNGDGYVCAFPVPDQSCISFIVILGLSACPVDQLYSYMDNHIPR
jgi:hypothetical protein